MRSHIHEVYNILVASTRDRVHIPNKDGNITLLECIESAKHFKINEDERYPRFVTPKDALLPYDDITIEAVYDDAPVVFVGWNSDTAPIEFEVGVLLKLPKGWVPVGSILRVKDEGLIFDTETLTGRGLPESVIESIANQLLRMFISSLDLINNSEHIKRKPLKSSSPKMMRRGQCKGFTYHTLKINRELVEVNEHQGGTHASPRFHERRGHYRTYKSGKRVWVRNTTVGSLDKGMVMKDYEL